MVTQIPNEFSIADASEAILVVGGDGFLGSHIVNQFLAQPHPPRIHILDLQQRWPDRANVTYHIGSLLDYDFLVETLRHNNITCVFHTASPPHGKPKAFYWSVNVDGSKLLIQACIETGVQKLIYTSSASVVFNGTDLYEATEDMLYCEVPLDAYTETKVRVTMCLSL
jgi:sterol-4alpha-carboxylate 3-dehydrogenase (decarboxylating)